ncbi:Zinc carboxypeptidase [Pedobacter westerhofensis]|uniref:Zinc carboxypeptidase n=1 Tax=Pedobacter westerhofensis TaxID=425512 RepID=A0A521FRC0_9SPHI|nr:M14 family zinc carboxypeptidase [Pedobacter westerhofensis]SMO98682.1 Zinc carboxypeptidase [Pedobacter westerhofensis]
MKQFVKITKLLTVLSIFWIQQAAAQNNYFFPKATSLDAKIPTPEQFLGYPIGTYYTRIDQVAAYFRQLEKVSDRVHVQSIGKTYEQREQIIVTITAPSNYAKLEQIRQEHLTQVDPAKPVLSPSAPIIIHLGYGVHGNETSSTETSLLTGYYLAASNDAETQKWLSESVIFIDPALNPDGRDRAANWHNAYHSFPAVGDPVDKEHQEAWPNGRTNHYFTDLNRDWLNLVQVESRNRLAFFHQWYPNVQIDFHEQGANATYYFEPTPKSHESPIIPQFLYDFQVILAKYHAKALDDIGSLYFTKENYDNLSPIYGSTYPKFFGSVAATFEQASSRGILQESSNGPLTFAFTIRNHLATSFSTIRGAVEEKSGLFKVQKDFFKYALAQGQKNPAKGFVFGDSNDINLTQKFLGLLLQHHVEVYEVQDKLTQEGKTFEKGKSYIVPSAQPNFLIVHSIFEENALKDSIFYDNTGWSIVHAYGLKYAKLNTAFAKGATVKSLPAETGRLTGAQSAYAYLINSADYNFTKALYQLQLKKVFVKTAFKPFAVSVGSASVTSGDFGAAGSAGSNSAVGNAKSTGNSSSSKKSYLPGSLVIPVVGQSLSPDSLYAALKSVAVSANVEILPVSTGFSAEGIDLGSNNIRGLRKPEVALAFGQGVTASEAGQVWFLLNQQLNLPVSKIDLQSFARAPLNRYNVLVLPGGTYTEWDKATVDKIKNWVNEGGTLITFQTATAWAVKQGIVQEKLSETDNFARRGETPPAAPVEKTKSADSAAKSAKPVRDRLDYARQEDVEGSKRINGAIFQADLDITHPIAFGVTSRKLFINKNGPTLLLPSANKYATVAQYSAKPFINGYSSKANIGKVANSAAIIATTSGSGEVILFADDPTYRGYWLGTGRLFLNAIFFGNLLNTGYR